jgi:hypothetical protein
MERAVAHVPLEDERWWMCTGVAGCSATDEEKKKAVRGRTAWHESDQR